MDYFINYLTIINSFMKQYGIYVAVFGIVAGIICIIVGRNKHIGEYKTIGVMLIIVGLLCAVSFAQNHNFFPEVGTYGFFFTGNGT
ncbi:MAG: hypothetical protein LUI02_01160 [Clostridiales bacterium]|nr:hypothetical protein [Clostridiales bacterium]